MDYVIQVPAQLSSHLRALRKALHLSQAALGARLGLSQARVARIESDPLSISVGQLFQVLAALGVRVTLDSTASIHVSGALPALTGQRKVTAGKAAKKPDLTPRNGDW